MTDQTSILASIGVKAIAILAFSNWDADTCSNIAEVIAAENIDLNDKEEIRDLCQRHEVDTSDYGDNALSVSFGHAPQLDQDVIGAALRRLHDATDAGDADDEQKASQGVIALLAQAVGTRVK